MSSSYSSLDWVLSHWVHLTVDLFVFICVYFVCFCFISQYYSEHGGVDMMGLKPDPWDLSPFSALTLLVGSVVPDMTYNVFGGMLNLALSIHGSSAAFAATMQHATQ